MRDKREKSPFVVTINSLRGLRKDAALGAFCKPVAAARNAQFGAKPGRPSRWNGAGIDTSGNSLQSPAVRGDWPGELAAWCPLHPYRCRNLRNVQLNGRVCELTRKKIFRFHRSRVDRASGRRWAARLTLAAARQPCPDTKPSFSAACDALAFETDKLIICVATRLFWGRLRIS